MDSQLPIHTDSNADQNLRILIVEDNELDQALVKRELKKSDLTFVEVAVDNRVDFLSALETFRPSIILCDYSMPQFGALSALTILQEKKLDIPLIIVTGTLTDEMAVECLKKGAIDYIIKDKILRLPISIKNVLDLRRSQKAKLKTEELLKQSEMQLKVITDILPASLSYISKDYIFQFSNKINLDWFGKDIIGLHVKDILGDQVFKMIQKSFLNLNSFESELNFPDAPKYVNITLAPEVRSSNIQGFVCMITDITEQKIYEDKLKAAKSEAENANSAKTQFLANMSHEIRTPLNAIMGLSELLMSNYKDEAERAQWMKKIVRNSEHLKKVIDEILDLSKIEAGKLQVDIGRFPVTQVIAQVKSILSPLAAEKKLELSFETVGKVPEYIFSDLVKLQHILLNLVGNAIKFSHVGPIYINVQLIEENKKPILLFIIKDKGIGMSSDQAKHLFTPFTQVDNSMTRRFGGTGLGLALAKQLGQALGGDVYLEESSPGKGSTFTVGIDPGDISQTDYISSFKNLLSEPADEQEQKVAHADLSNFKVLLVEDSLDNQLLIQNFLEMEGVQVDLASDGKEGMEKALKGQHDLVIMDIQMPVMDGYSATANLRSQGYKKPIIAFTAHAFQDERERCLRIGFNDFLSKPIKKSELIKCVSKYREIHLTTV